MNRNVQNQCRALIIAILFMMIAFGGCTGSKGQVAFTVNDLEVEKTELIYYMRQNSSVIAAELEETYGLDSTADDFWTKEAQGIVPLDYLQSETIKQIARTKIEQLCAEKHGIKTPLYYSQQLKEQKELNKKRKEAEAAGEILYGPTERDFTAYFAEFYLSMKKDLKEKLIGDGSIRISENEVRAYYNENISRLTGNFEENQGPIYNELLEKAYQELIDSEMKSVSIQNREITINVSDIT